MKSACTFLVCVTAAFGHGGYPTQPYQETKLWQEKYANQPWQQMQPTTNDQFTDYAKFSQQRQPWQQIQSTARLAEKFASTLEGEDFSSLFQFYDQTSVVSFPSDLPYGGVYKGTDIPLFFKRLTSTVSIDNFDYNIIGVNEGSGVAMIQTTMDGTLTKTGKRVFLSFVHAVEFNLVTSKIMTHLIINKQVTETLNQYWTSAEKKLSELINAFFTSSPSHLMDMNSPAWNMISNNIKVKVDMYPNIAHGGKTQWNGKQELIQHMTEMHSKGFKISKEDFLEDMQFKILFSDDDEVYVKIWNTEMAPHCMLVHYTFDHQGKLVSEEITIPKAMHAWDIFAFPMPKASKSHEMMKEMGMHHQMHHQMMKKMGMHHQGQQANWNIGQPNWNIPSTSTIDPSEPVVHCDSTTGNQKCKNGTPCSDQYLDCSQGPNRCICPQTTGFMRTTSMGQQPWMNQRNWNIPSTSTIDPSEPVVHCDSTTGNQKCKNGTPCSDQYLDCSQGPNRCICPQTTGFMPTTSMGQQPWKGIYQPFPYASGIHTPHTLNIQKVDELNHVGTFTVGDVKVNQASFKNELEIEGRK